MIFYNERELKAYYRLLEKIEHTATTFGDTVIFTDNWVAKTFRGSTLRDWLYDLEKQKLVSLQETPLLPWQTGYTIDENNGRYVVRVRAGFSKYIEQVDAKMQAALDELAAQKPKQPKKKSAPRPIEKPAETPEAQVKVMFDAKASTLKYGDTECDIPDEKLEYYVCKLVFKNRRLAVTETDILDAAHKERAGNRAVYDAVRRINKKAEDTFNIHELLFFKAAKVRVNKIYQ